MSELPTLLVKDIRMEKFRAAVEQKAKEKSISPRQINNLKTLFNLVPNSAVANDMNKFISKNDLFSVEELKYLRLTLAKTRNRKKSKMTTVDVTKGVAKKLENLKGPLRASSKSKVIEWLIDNYENIE